MIDARNYKLAVQLKDGTAATIRAIRSDDKKLLVEAFKNLDTESIYTRFFGYKSELTDEELKTATEGDFEQKVALVVTTAAEGGKETIIGAGHYVLFAPPNELRSAEIAFIVEEDYQGQGIASTLLKNLIHIAREKGVCQFEAEVLRKNKSMLAVLARSGLPMKQSFEGSAIHLTLALKADAP